MSITLTALANTAAQFLGSLDSGEGLSNQQLLDAQAAANDMLDNWSSDGLFALSDVVTQWNLAGGVQSYSIGPGQAINITRPVKIQAASFINPLGPGGPVEVLNEGAWAALPDRQRQSYIVQNLFWDRGNPTGTVYLSPVPLGVMRGEIHTWQPLAQFPDLTTAVAILPGYLEMMKFGLAIVLAPQYDMTPSATLQSLFSDAAGRVRRLNASLLGEVPPESQAAQ